MNGKRNFFGKIQLIHKRCRFWGMHYDVLLWLKGSKLNPTGQIGWKKRNIPDLWEGRKNRKKGKKAFGISATGAVGGQGQLPRAGGSGGLPGKERGVRFVPAVAAGAATAVGRGMRGGRRTGEEKGRLLLRDEEAALSSPPARAPFAGPITPGKSDALFGRTLSARIKIAGSPERGRKRCFPPADFQ